jgi:hypothetical protein
LKIGDIVKKNPKIDRLSTGEVGLVLRTDESLAVTSHCVEVIFPVSGINVYRISMLELVNENR